MAFVKKTFYLSILFLFFFGCRKSTNANWDVDLVLPVVSSVLNIKNFVSDSLFNVDNSGLLHIKFNREVASLKLDSLLNLPDTTIPAHFISTFPTTLKIPPGEAIPLLNGGFSELEFDVGDGVKLKRVEIRKGFLTVKFSNDIAQPLDLKYKLNQITKNGVPFLIAETIPTGSNSVVRSYDLAGYNFDLKGLNGFKFNTIAQAFTVAVNANADTASVDYGKGAHVEIGYSEIIPQYAEGYFGQQTIDVKLDTARFGFAQNFKASNFMLSDARMDFTIQNQFGAEFTSSLYNNKSINSPNNNIVPLQTNQLSNINVNRATKSGNTIYPSVKNISFTSTNSNITAFLSNLPDKLTYQGNVKLNPLGNISGYNDFAYYNTGIRIAADIDIPLKFKADSFELRSDAKVDFGNVEQLDKVNYGNFVIAATNGFPFAVKLQAYMYDEQNRKIDSLFVPGQNVIDKGVLNFNNEVITPVKKKVAIPVTKGKIESLKRCKVIRVYAWFIMPDNRPELKILEHYEISINIIAQLNYNVGLGG